MDLIRKKIVSLPSYNGVARDIQQSLFIMGLASLRGNKVGKAIMYFEASWEINPQDRAVLEILALTYSLAGLFQKAAAHYIELISKDPEKINYWLELGDCFLQLKDHNKALSIFEQGLIINPGSYQLLRSMGQCYLELKQPEKAALLFEQALDNHKTDAMSRIFVAGIYSDLNKNTKVIEVLDGLLSNQHTAKSYWLLSLSYKRIKNWEQCQSYAEKCIQKSLHSMWGKIKEVALY
jgi:tetratricopeptide (TPR) repeat protein